MALVDAIARDSVRLVAAPTKVQETALVLVGRSGPRARDILEGLLAKLEIVVEPFGDDQADAAVAAFTEFGRGRGGPLNYGDCLAYALAKTSGEALLFKGNDFARTDIASAI